MEEHGPAAHQRDVRPVLLLALAALPTLGATWRAVCSCADGAAPGRWAGGCSTGRACGSTP
jgi:hypothetical protein